MLRPTWYVRRELPDIAASVVVKKRGSEVVAIDGSTRLPIARSSDDASLWNELIDWIVSHGYRVAKIVAMGRFRLSSDVTIQKNGLRLFIEGHGMGYDEQPCEFVLDGARMLDDNTKWGMVKLSNVTLKTIGTFDSVPIYLPKTLVYLEDCELQALHLYTGSGPQFMISGGSGPPGNPVLWRNVHLHDGRRGGGSQYGELTYLWYEGFRWSGGTITINVPEDIGWISFMRVAGNIYAVFEDIDLFLATLGTNKYIRFWMSDVDAYFDRVEFLETKYIVEYHIRPIANTYPVLYLNECRLKEAGSLILPKVHPNYRVILGSSYRRRGVATLSGDGTTKVFKIGTHDLKPDVTSSELDMVAVMVWPLSADALAASPVRGYLQDDDGDGIYESIYVEFANAPASGTNNVKVAWEVAYVDAYH